MLKAYSKRGPVCLCAHTSTWKLILISVCWYSCVFFPLAINMQVFGSSVAFKDYLLLSGSILPQQDASSSFHLDASTLKPPYFVCVCVYVCVRFVKLLGILDLVISLAALLAVFLSSVTALLLFFLFLFRPSHEPKFTLAVCCIFHDFLKGFSSLASSGLQSKLVFYLHQPHVVTQRETRGTNPGGL